VQCVPVEDLLSSDPPITWRIIDEAVDGLSLLIPDFARARAGFAVSIGAGLRLGQRFLPASEFEATGWLGVARFGREFLLGWSR